MHRVKYEEEAWSIHDLPKYANFHMNRVSRLYPLGLMEASLYRMIDSVIDPW
jgi:hypothetical protein